MPETVDINQEILVSLDLEATGLNTDSDLIIQVGAVKFRGDSVIETFDQLVNPSRLLPTFITQLTGITQSDVDQAIPWPEVAAPLKDFIGDHPIVGHNIAFDLKMLAKSGLNLHNSNFDTYDLATIFVPNAQEYSLGGLAEAFGIPFRKAHTAIVDAQMCHQLFLRLIDLAIRYDKRVLGALSVLAERSNWQLHTLFKLLANGFNGDMKDRGANLLFNHESLIRQFSFPKPIPFNDQPEPISIEQLKSMFSIKGPISTAIPNYEPRDEQVQMALAIAKAFNENRNLIVEAGTGVGKSMAYLLPAMVFGKTNNTRIVVSTNTLNLQTQLINKDLPFVENALRGPNTETSTNSKFSVLKGKNNYVCLRRLAHLAETESLSSEDARMLSKTLVWLQNTSTGDKSEINIPRRANHLWDKISAAGTKDCETLQGLCPLRVARARADGSNIVIVNHSLLIADAAIGGGLIPQYDYLIVDEAHHLVEEATRQFGYSVSSEQLADLFRETAREIANFKSLVAYKVRNSNQKLALTEEAVKATEVLKHLTDSWDHLTAVTSRFVQNQQEYSNQLRVTRSTRKQPDWVHIEIGWENVSQHLDSLGQHLSKLLTAIDTFQSETINDTVEEISNLTVRIDETKLRISDFVVLYEDEKVYWINLTGPGALPTLNCVPLEVSNKLNDAIFSEKKSTILTSATLSIDGSLDYLANETGLEDADHLIVGSPFDYKKSALVITAPDVPEPYESGYQQKLEDILVHVAEASNGGILALFTSHSALQTTRKHIKPILEKQGVTVLAQGVDGSPDQLMKAMTTNINTVLLGTSSLWEGIDLPGDALRVVVLARLPFAVPTDPVVSARSEKYEDPFSKLTIPEAILRFRQGFGRLIRTSSDRGIVLILDSRIVNKSYGKIFLRSLPNATFHETMSRNIGHEIRNWLKT